MARRKHLMSKSSQLLVLVLHPSIDCGPHILVPENWTAIVTWNIPAANNL